MFARYNYSASATLANIAADIIAILTGETNKANLSAGCDQTNTYILNTYTNAAWTVHDAAAGTNKQVLNGERHDQAGNYEYLLLDYNTAGFLQLRAYETWDATTHAGTNGCDPLATTQQQRITVGVDASMIIYANGGKCCLLFSNVAAGWGASGNNEWTGVFQRSRLSPWDTTGNNYPLAVQTTGQKAFASGQYSQACRYKNPAGGDFTGTAADLHTSLRGWGSLGSTAAAASGSNVQVNKVPDGVGGFYSPLNDIRFDYQTNAFLGGSISEVCDVWLGPRYPANLDEIQYSGKTYVLLANTNTSNGASGQTGNLAVPKG